MKKYLAFFLLSSIVLFTSWKLTTQEQDYASFYKERINHLENSLAQLKALLQKGVEKEQVLLQLNQTRIALKSVDFWMRYTNPIAYKMINGPLPVEWEVEVFEKWEKPYKREAAGLTLLQLAFDEGLPKPEQLKLVHNALDSIAVFKSDKTLDKIKSPNVFYYANRLHLLNLATIYTTGFECPNTDLVISELDTMLAIQLEDYSYFNNSFPEFKLDEQYMQLYSAMRNYVSLQESDFTAFDHFSFIKNYVNPLFGLNQSYLKQYDLRSDDVNDYSLSDEVVTIFDKSLYKGMESKGVFKGLRSEQDLERLFRLGEQLFHDPILSVNNKRSCASCHKPSQFFTDTTIKTAITLDGVNRLPRNTPSLIGSLKNHLLSLDGRHIHPSKQADEVIQNPIELGLGSKEIVPKVLRVPAYKKELKKLARKTINDELTNDHIFSAIIFYYSKFDNASSAFDRAMNNEEALDIEAQKGFTIFMSKAECGTCHFAPQFNGIKPPYVSSEFEVIGVPEDTAYAKLSEDLGRGKVHEVEEMQNAFRTPSLRNLSFTSPYMHNGVFHTLDEVLNLYNTGGGAGNGLEVPNQTLNSEELHLTADELAALKAFLRSLDESISLPKEDVVLPKARGELKFRQTTY